MLTPRWLLRWFHTTTLPCREIKALLWMAASKPTACLNCQRACKPDVGQTTDPSCGCLAGFDARAGLCPPSWVPRNFKTSNRFDHAPYPGGWYPESGVTSPSIYAVRFRRTSLSEPPSHRIGVEGFLLSPLLGVSYLVPGT